MVRPFFKILVNPSFGGQPNAAELLQLNKDAVICSRPYTNSFDGEDSLIDWSNPDLYLIGWNQAEKRIAPFLNAQHGPSHLWEIICEPGFGPGTASFWQGALDWADQHHTPEYPIGLCLFNFSVGNPPLELWKQPDIVVIIDRIHQSHHAIGLDQYTIPDGADGENGAWDSPDFMLRHEQVVAQLPENLRDVRIFLLEYGIVNGKKYGADKMIAGWELWLSKNEHCSGAAAYYGGNSGADTDSVLDNNLDAMKAFWLKAR